MCLEQALGLLSRLSMGSCPCRSKRPADRPVEMQFGPSAGSLASRGGRDALGTAEILIKFLKGQGTDSEERTLEDILKSNDDWMEACHNYVQWIFPTDEASMFNRAAPMMTPHVQKVCREDQEIQANFDLILKRFLSFLGLEMKADAGELQIVRADHFSSRERDCWLSFFGGNHNWLRISRVLHCLGMIGKKAEQQALMKCLEGMRADYPEVMSAMPHWRRRAEVG
eukprot:s2427_g21.t1